MPGRGKKLLLILQKAAYLAVSLALGLACGFLIARCADAAFEDMPSFGLFLLFFAGMLLLLYLLFFLHLILHEAGHLLFGLLSGYRFSSFRIMSFLWLRQGGRIRIKRLSIPGTAGQCLMIPPEPAEGMFPVVLYNLGGVFMDLFAAVFSALLLLLPLPPVPAALAEMSALIGGYMALSNGVPLRLGTVDNDGRNTLSLLRDREARRAFWIQMKIASLTYGDGVRLRDMPQEWFTLPPEQALGNSMHSALAVFAAGRLMDAHRFSEADALMAHLLEQADGLVGVHRLGLLCERVYLELIGQNRPEVLSSLLTPELGKYLRAARAGNLSVVRVSYALALLRDRDGKKISAARAQFEKLARVWPSASDVQAEREFMALADQAAAQAPAPEPAEK